jgi:hypothetical protein
MTKEEEDEYVKKFVKSEQRRSPSRNASPARKTTSKKGSSPGRSSPRASRSPERSSNVPRSAVDLNVSGDLSPSRQRRYKLVDPAEWDARHVKHIARDRARAYDQSIKHDILFCGRAGSMNITYDPYYHGPLHP